MKAASYRNGTKPKRGMSMARRAAKRDASEPEIVSTLEQCGFTVFRMDQPCDLLVGFRGKNYLVECKTEGSSYGKALNANQQAFNDYWRGGKMIRLASATEAMDWAVSIASGMAACHGIDVETVK